MVRSRRRARALTLFEVIIAVALMSLLLGTLLTFFWQTLRIREQAGKNALRTQVAQQVLQRMADELRACTAKSEMGFAVEQFIGERRNISFVTTPLPPTDLYEFFREGELAPPPRHDLRQVTYELWVDEDEETEEGDPMVAGIVRTERRVLKPYETEDELAEGEDPLWLRRDLWAPELGYLEFRYFDGVEWTTTWEVSQGNKLPLQIQITVGFDSLTQSEYDDEDLEEYPIEDYPLGPDLPNIDRFRTIVRLPAADQMYTARVYRLQDQVAEVYEMFAPGEGGQFGGFGEEGELGEFGDGGMIDEEEDW